MTDAVESHRTQLQPVTDGERLQWRERLLTATKNGRLTNAEYHDRLAIVMAADTTAELAVAVYDLADVGPSLPEPQEARALQRPRTGRLGMEDVKTSVIFAGVTGVMTVGPGVAVVDMPVLGVGVWLVTLASAGIAVRWSRRRDSRPD